MGIVEWMVGTMAMMLLGSQHLDFSPSPMLKDGFLVMHTLGGSKYLSPCPVQGKSPILEAQVEFWLGLGPPMTVGI